MSNALDTAPVVLELMAVHFVLMEQDVEAARSAVEAGVAYGRFLGFLSGLEACGVVRAPATVGVRHSAGLFFGGRLARFAQVLTVPVETAAPADPRSLDFTVPAEGKVH